jgi:CheY-like chemotaxis protein
VVSGKHQLVVALTDNAGDREQFLSLGFDDYLSKPVSPDELYTVLDQMSIELALA